jgi:Asp-tRNA(Asn)/Glu-tRNA(Gln) amidotransferase A subunit family amidase
MLGMYTTFVNLLDLCALTVPVDDVGEADRPPPSLSFVAPAWSENLLVSLGQRLLQGTPASPRTP